MRRRDRGAVLLLVLAAVAILTILAVEMASRASADSLSATRSRRDGAFRRLFDSGAELGRGLLAERASERFDAWGQSWNQPLRFTLGEGETAAVQLSDESGKLKVSRNFGRTDELPVLRGRLDRLFDYLALHDRGRSRRWKDIGEKVKERVSRQRPLLTLDGLRESGLDREDVFGAEGLCRFLTCFGDGSINLNTAPRAVLYSIDPDVDDAMVDRIAQFRGKGDGAFGVYRAYQEPRDLMRVEGIVNRSVGADGRPVVTRNLYEKLQGVLSVTSSCFSARIDAGVDGRSRQAWLFLRPSGSRVAFEEIQP